jgi:hypothetical protein
MRGITSLLDGWLVDCQVRKKGALEMSFVDVDFDEG